jgi:hypothetical protein
MPTQGRGAQGIHAGEEVAGTGEDGGAHRPRRKAGGALRMGAAVRRARRKAAGRGVWGANVGKGAGWGRVHRGGARTPGRALHAGAVARRKAEGSTSRARLCPGNGRWHAGGGRKRSLTAGRKGEGSDSGRGGCAGAHGRGDARSQGSGRGGREDAAARSRQRLDGAVAASPRSP